MTQSFEEEVAPTETQTVPAGMAAEFSSLTTPYCWVVTEDLVAGYDGAEPSAVGGARPAELGGCHHRIPSGRPVGGFVRPVRETS